MMPANSAPECSAPEWKQIASREAAEWRNLPRVQLPAECSPSQCIGSWCCVAAGSDKFVFARPGSATVLKVMRQDVVSISPRIARRINKQRAAYKQICRLAQRDTAADRVPWTGKAFRLHQLIAFSQQRLSGLCLRVRDGLLMVHHMYARAERYGFGNASRTVAAVTLRDFLGWHSFLVRAKLVMHDLQFVLNEVGEVWLIDPLSSTLSKQKRPHYTLGSPLMGSVSL